MGNRALNYVTGISTPNINDFAKEGMSLMRMYTEPSCTPTRTAMLTGRHPVRTGLKEVKVALVGEGLAEEEVTIAEILSKAGYNTAHIGKWHQGDIEEAYPHNQGFDFAAFPIHQQVQLSLMSKEGAESNNLLGWHHKTQSDSFALDHKFKPYGLVTGVEAKKGGKAREVDLKPGEEWTQAHYIKMNERYQAQTLEQLKSLGKQDKPFFLQYWPLWPLNFVHDQDQNLSLNGGFHAEKLQLIDGWIGQIFDEVDRLGIADNTLVVLMADNGLMYHYGRNIRADRTDLSGRQDAAFRRRCQGLMRSPAGPALSKRAVRRVTSSTLLTCSRRLPSLHKRISISLATVSLMVLIKLHYC